MEMGKRRTKSSRGSEKSICLVCWLITMTLYPYFWNATRHLLVWVICCPTGSLMALKNPSPLLRSRRLLPAEKNYSQIDREGLEPVFGVKKFHQYLYGTSFELITDHEPLTKLFAPDRVISPTASARIQRWALTLAAY